MTYEQARKELEKYKDNLHMIARLREDEREYAEKTKSASGQRITGMPTSQGRMHDLSDIASTLETIQERIKQAERRKAHVDRKLALMETEEYASILTLRYKKELNLAEIGTVLHMATSTVANKIKPAIIEYTMVK